MTELHEGVNLRPHLEYGVKLARVFSNALYGNVNGYLIVSRKEFDTFEGFVTADLNANGSHSWIKLTKLTGSPRAEVRLITFEPEQV